MLGVMKVVLTIVEVISSALLLTVILMQRSKGQGVVAFGGGMGETLFGSQMGNVLTKATVVLAFIFLANTVLLVNVGNRQSTSSVTDRVEVATPAPIGPSAGGAGRGSPVGNIPEPGVDDYTPPLEESPVPVPTPEAAEPEPTPLPAE